VSERAYMDEAIQAEEAARLFGLCAATFLRRRACLPSFPQPVNHKPKAWIRREVLEWRDYHRAERIAA
jgi:predicted DNA-binding transcriptional regulator AlpA